MTAPQDRGHRGELVSGRRNGPIRAGAAGINSAQEATLATHHGRRDYWLRRALAAVDMVAVVGGLLTAFAISPIHGLSAVIWLFPLLPAWLIVFALYGLYGRDLKRIGQGALDDLPSLFHAFLIGGLGMWLYYRVLPIRRLTLEELVVFGLASPTLVLALRWMARRVARRVFGSERVLLVGKAPVTAAVVRKMKAHPEYGLRAIGIVSGGDAPRPGNGAGGVDSSIPALGGLADADILRLIELHNVERVLVAQHEVDDDLMLDLSRICGQLGVKVSVLTRHVEVMGPSTEIDDIEGVTVLGLNPLVLSRSSRIAKRGMDIAGASIGLLILSPVMALAALAVKLDSPGPIFFRQPRIGRGGEPFSLLKFRTMVRDAESLTPALMPFSHDPHWLNVDHDPRVTGSGRPLRLLSIDELPQLWNVLTGKMSLVGPRPLPRADHAQIGDWAMIRLDLAPGLTGLWQVLGRARIPFEEMIKLDYVYVTNWSLWMDIKLLLRTVPAVMRRRGAN